MVAGGPSPFDTSSSSTGGTHRDTSDPWRQGFGWQELFIGPADDGGNAPWNQGSPRIRWDEATVVSLPMLSVGAGAVT